MNKDKTSESYKLKHTNEAPIGYSPGYLNHRIKQLEEENHKLHVSKINADDLKVCGNCEHIDKISTRIYCSSGKTKIEYVDPNNHCDNWQYDNMTQSQRKI